MGGFNMKKLILFILFLFICTTAQAENYKVLEFDFLRFAISKNYYQFKADGVFIINEAVGAYKYTYKKDGLAWCFVPDNKCFIGFMATNTKISGWKIGLEAENFNLIYGVKNGEN